MILYVIVALATILAAGLIRQPLSQTDMPYQKTRWQMLNIAGLIFIFAVLFITSAIRLNVGNDYFRYVEFMHLIVHNAYVPTELGFNGIVRIIYGLSGFENYLLVFAFFSFTTILVFMWSIYRDSENFWFSFFLFMSFGLYFQSFSTVRYYLALAIALFSIPFVLSKKWIHFILLILLGAAFHKSILVVLPLYFLASLKWKKWALAVAGLFLTTLFFWQDFYLKMLVFVYPTYRDTDYLEGGTSIINIIRCGGILILSLLYYREAVKDNDRNRFYFSLNIAALLLYTCGSFIPVISRIGFYLTATHIFFLPELLNKIEDKKKRHILTALVIAAGILYLAIFLLRAKEDGIRLLPYQTFLFHEMSFPWAY
ncbi:MAG: EpsG family protein [Lachnospiraceae bacterium]|nr:EpsG family protein [Lachnospiraceae bacterium]